MVQRRPGVYGVALGTGGRAKVPGFLHASRGWAPLSAAVISSPLMGLLFLHGLESNPGSSLQTEEEAGLP